MHTILQTSWGYFLTFQGRVTAEEMRRWIADSQVALGHVPKRFGVIVDLRGLELLGKKARELMISGQRLYRKMGMTRSAVIVNSTLTEMQFSRIASESDISQTERTIDEWQEPNFWKIAEDWVIQGIEPQENPARQNIAR
ncbi:MAG: hypothetical protein AB1921_06715 [Thermodesulfobacteriota bacterium]